VESAQALEGLYNSLHKSYFELLPSVPSEAGLPLQNSQPQHKRKFRKRRAEQSSGACANKNLQEIPLRKRKRKKGLFCDTVTPLF